MRQLTDEEIDEKVEAIKNIIRPLHVTDFLVIIFVVTFDVIKSVEMVKRKRKPTKEEVMELISGAWDRLQEDEEGQMVH